MKHALRKLAPTGLALTLLATTGCGQVADLEPLPGYSMPVAPHGATEPKTTEELLKLDPQAVPERSVELRRRSEEREDDPFELPPPE